jgi:HEAT repeat protein
MSNTTRITVGLLTVALMLCWALPATALADEALDKSFEALKTYEWGTDRGVLKAIDDAVVSSHGDALARRELEKRLCAALGEDTPHAAKDYICRKLSLIGTGDCVPTVAVLLTDEKLSHMSRYALERIPDDAAVAAMRGALPKVSGKTKVGVINSLGVRRDAQSGAALTALLKDSDKEIAAAAAAALGSIGNQDAAKALAGFITSAPDGLKLAAADAYLACAERLLADGKKTDALAIYKALNTPDQPDHVQIAAKRGLLAAMKSN